VTAAVTFGDQFGKDRPWVGRGVEKPSVLRFRRAELVGWDDWLPAGGVAGRVVSSTGEVGRGVIDVEVGGVLVRVHGDDLLELDVPWSLLPGRARPW
jgi:hypothetical protein